MRFEAFPTWMMSRRIDFPTMWSYTELMFQVWRSWNCEGSRVLLWTISPLIQQGRGLFEILFRNDPSTSWADRISSKICLSVAKASAAPLRNAT